MQEAKQDPAVKHHRGDLSPQGKGQAQVAAAPRRASLVMDAGSEAQRKKEAALGATQPVTRAPVLEPGSPESVDARAPTPSPPSVLHPLSSLPMRGVEVYAQAPGPGLRQLAARRSLEAPAQELDSPTSPLEAPAGAERLLDSKRKTHLGLRIKAEVLSWLPCRGLSLLQNIPEVCHCW